MNPSIQQTDVLIVGSGPTGLVSALLLAKLGIPSIVLEKNPHTDEHPKAHELNARSVEILREIGITEEELAEEASPFEDGSRILFCRTINEEIGRIDLMADPERNQKYREHLRSPLPYFNLSQSEFEKILVRHVQGNSLIDLRFEHEWEGMEIVDQTVISHVRSISDGQEYRIRSRYLLAADGAGSPVRRSTGIEMEGPAEIQRFVNAYFEANLRNHVKTAAKLYWILKPEFAGAFIAHHIDRRWVYGVPIYSPYESAEDYTPDVLKKRIVGALGLEDCDIEIKSTSVWRMSAQLARSYRKGRVFLVGDAAHRFPPTGGLGMNSGIADAHNLCWKLAEVMSGRASDVLLDTYEAERRPVAKRNCDESEFNYHKVFEVFEAMGLRRDGLEMLTRLFNTAPVRLFPEPIKKIIRQLANAVADRFVKKSIDDPATRKKVLRSIDEQIGHFDRLGLDIGYHYESDAIQPGVATSSAQRHAVSDYSPSTSPGYRLPHVWLESNTQRISSHDLLDYGRYTLITPGNSDIWKSAARSITEGWKVQLEVVSLEDCCDATGENALTFDLAHNGAILVRPDGHIAWRCEFASDEPARDLADVFGQVHAVAPPVAAAR